MKLSKSKEWVFVISASFSMLSVAVGIWQTLGEYQLKLKAEKRLAISSQAETDIRLLNAFNELVQLATGEEDDKLSEKTIEMLFNNGYISESDFSDPRKLNKKLWNAAAFGDPPGKSVAVIAISAIAELSDRYPFLREVGIQALQRPHIKQLCPEIVKGYLKKLLEKQKAEINKHLKKDI